ncbi:hypothetical protein SETIT_3G322600v2 [Setaria italica]|uniref:GTD-binding domain-containing protein n=1 Tax=Setaria italica TaxID=4555 RepID=K3Z6J0_SETIT|nr:uncharacterized protein LOC101761729 [Setaria italica]RCV18692.1 hypothetical protein SETIT_3G322600v2 [Setaria italica]
MLRELLAVAARAALEWALASLLLANGAAFCLIAAAAARLRLGQPCILCARVHRLLCSSPASAGDGRGALRLLLCDAHLAAVAAEPPAHHDHRRDVASRKAGLVEPDDPDKVSGLETHRVVSIGSEICEQDHDVNGQPLAADRSSISRTTSSSEGGGSGPLVSLFELSPIIARPRDGGGAGDSSVDPATAAPELVAVDGDELLTVGQIVSALREQRRELEALRAELASERRAAAEAEERRRQLEEQGELDREAARLAMQLVHESETEKHGLQRQLEACRVRAQLYQLDDDAMDGEDAGGEGGRWESNGGGDGNNYQSLVDFLPGSVYSSSPDLANLLKLCTEAGNGGGRRQRDDYYGEPAVAVVEEEAEEEEVMAVAVTVTAATESSGSVVGATTTIVAEPLHERSTNSCHVETVAEAA